VHSTNEQLVVEVRHVSNVINNLLFLVLMTFEFVVSLYNVIQLCMFRNLGFPSYFPSYFYMNGDRNEIIEFSSLVGCCSLLAHSCQ
jgi:hypothetical protein